MSGSANTLFPQAGPFLILQQPSQQELSHLPGLANCQRFCKELSVHLPWHATDGMTPCKSEGKKPECTNGQRLVLQ